MNSKDLEKIVSGRRMVKTTAQKPLLREKNFKKLFKKCVRYLGKDEEKSLIFPGSIGGGWLRHYATSSSGGPFIASPSKSVVNALTRSLIDVGSNFHFEFIRESDSTVAIHCIYDSIIGSRLIAVVDKKSFKPFDEKVSKKPGKKLAKKPRKPFDGSVCAIFVWDRPGKRPVVIRAVSVRQARSMAVELDGVTVEDVSPAPVRYRFSQVPTVLCW